MSQQNGGEQIELINHLGEPICETKLASSVYAFLTHPTTIQPHHEALVPVKTYQGKSAVSFAKSYEPLVQRCGIAIFKPYYWILEQIPDLSNIDFSTTNV